ncbi:MAG: hypothetical protein N2Z76_07590, partial [Treponemataceae bacterium]|nr:hypothetical protein [Treponemataceae bacterium]
MKKKRYYGTRILWGIMGILGLMLGSCTSKSGSSVKEGEVSGKIVVLTHRTDWVNTKFQDYKKAFNAKYPKVEVEFEAITDYEGTVRTRMSTKEYGDV